MRRSADQTRDLLLQTAVQLLHEKGTAAGVGHIRLADVVKRAGLTTGAAYRLWADQEEFHRDLAVCAMRRQGQVMLEVTTSAVAATVARGGTFTDLLRVASEANVAAMYESSSGGKETLALRAAAYNQPDLLHASTERTAAMQVGYHNLCVGLLQRFGMRMVAPYTVNQLIEGMSALVDGFGLKASSGEPHPTLQIADQQWTLIGVCVAALVDRMTEPDVPAHPRPRDGAE